MPKAETAVIWKTERDVRGWDRLLLVRVTGQGKAQGIRST